MTFVSYAGNFEDVMLWRALGREQDGRPRRRPGNWIDVGACDPVTDSVTHAFHLRGWRGLNLQSNPGRFQKLLAARPGDVNLSAAAGDSEGTLRFWYSLETGLLTGDPAVAERHRSESRLLAPLYVPVHRLAALCEAHGFDEIDFLRIDGTGTERAVLAGAGLHRLRPRIVLLKVVRPGSEQPTRGDWVDLLDQAGYREVYYDGLNRFYVAEEHRDALARHFAVPPNVFDAFVRADEEQRRIAREAEQRAAQAELGAARRLLAAEREVNRGERRVLQARDAVEQALRSRDEARHQAKQDVAAVEAHVVHLKSLLARTYSSTSWQISRPVRVLARTVQRLRRRAAPEVLEPVALEPQASPTTPEPVAAVLGLVHLGSRERAALRRVRREAP